jgi:hypothetical protein
LQTKFKHILDTTPSLKKLRIRSQGGDVVAAMKIADQVFDRQLDVTVEDYCLSACANYIFAAGKHKAISEGSIVGWHGDAHQKGIAALVKQYDQREAQGVESATASSVSIEMLLQNRSAMSYIKTTMEMEDAFFQRIGVLEESARYGLYPTKLADMWTMPVSDMRRFGICRVSASPSYGTDSYAKKASARVFSDADRIKVVTIAMRAEVLPEENARLPDRCVGE